MSELEIKERLAQRIFLDLMQEAGKKIIKLEYEKELQDLLKQGSKLEIKKIIKDINKHKHDFLLKTKDEFLFLNVFYNEGFVNHKAYNFDKGMGNTILIFIKNIEPYFGIAFVNEFKESGVLDSLENNKILKIDKHLIQKYKAIIKKRFS